ncbi:hypothetical protein F0562_027218 [Nyssa sinensis]|uniref:Uncharacterized protein n=1 Tax=Nyssa sinensis TaxID=561372 RepID=A0A5J5B4H7_9ASTE|nr:hypothetical protein F0562_027218 [Nyssa sinensis]
MAERRQTFRFRMPWQPVAQAPRPTVEQTPTQPTAAPAQRPPFRPPGLAPAQPTPPQVQASTRTESRTPSPSRANTQVQVTSQPQSPSGATQSQVASQPTPPPAAPQPQTASQPSSLSLTASQTQPVPQPQSQAQQTERAVNQPPSPSEKLQPTTQESSQLPPSSTEPPPSVFQQETNPTESQPVSQEQPKTENTSDNVLNSQNQTSIQTNFSPNGTATQPSEVSGPIAAAAPTQKVNSSVATAEPNPLPESDDNPEKTEEGKEIVQDLRKEGKINGIPYEEPKQRTVNEVFPVSSESKSPAKEQPSFTFQAKQKQQEKQTKTAIPFPHLKDKNTVREASFHKEIREDVSKLVQKMATGNPKHPITMDEKPVSVITLAGDYKTNPDETSEATTDGEGTSKERKSKNPNTSEDQARKAYINSNIQSLNNSIVFNSPVTERNPGVTLVLSRKPAEPMIKSNNRTESRRAEFNITPSQKLTYEPIVKRRCLRGLFIESSDSDPDNPEKPRRHGCRYDCGNKSKDTQIDVL